MTAQVADLVWETTTTQGAGAYSLAGAGGGPGSSTGAPAVKFADAFADGAEVLYSVYSEDGFEIGLGTLTHGSPDTLSRDTVLASSNSGAAVVWGAGTRNCFCSLAASEALLASRNLSEITPAAARTNLGLGSAAVEDVGTSAGDVPQLDGSARLPAVDGSQLTNLPVEVPSGSQMLFRQAAAPVGWTQQAGAGDRLIRITSGTGGGLGGSWTITGLTSAVTVDAHTLLLSQIPSHTHSLGQVLQVGVATDQNDGAHSPQNIYNPDTIASATGSAGSGSSHSHTASASIASNASWRPLYTNAIICQRD